jgi:hypothetical protein
VLVAPKQVPLYIVRGKVGRLAIAWKNGDGTLIDVTGYTSKFNIATAYGAEPVVELTEADGITLGEQTLTDDEGNEHTVNLLVDVDSANSTLLTADTYVYSWDAIEGGGEPHQVLHGPIYVTPSAIP